MRLRDYGRMVMSKLLDRDLLPNEIIHHKDGNHYNHAPENLELTNRADHCRIHKPAFGYKFTPEQRKQLSDSHKGFKVAEDTKQKIRKAMQGRIITWGNKITKAKCKVTKEEVLNYLSTNPEASRQDVNRYFSLKSNGPIARLGGLRKLRKEAV